MLWNSIFFIPLTLGPIALSFTLVFLSLHPSIFIKDISAHVCWIDLVFDLNFSGKSYVYFLFAEILIEFLCCKIFVKDFLIGLCIFDWFDIWYKVLSGWVIHCLPLSALSFVYFLFAGVGHPCPINTFFLC